MRKLFLLLLLVFAIKGFGQTYSFHFIYNATQRVNRTYTRYGWSISGVMSVTGESYSDINPNENRVFSTVPNLSQFDIELKSIWTNDLNDPTSCNKLYKNTISASNFIRTGFVRMTGCPSDELIIDDFKPNVTISNLDTANPSEICAESQLNLAGFPAGFPNEAYHWQYSLDNQGTWVDLPAPFNDKPNNLFTIKEILGASHNQYFHKVIYFRLGYGQNRAFTSPLAITYSPCAPEVKSISYTAPKCNGDAVQDITLTFTRDLKAGEYLYPFSIVEESKHTNIVYQSPDKVTVFEGLDPLNKTISIKNVIGLQNGVSYIINYQAYDGSINRGILESPAFTHVEPSVLKYAISNSIQPTCFGGSDGSIEIQLLSGTAPYHFYQDNIEVTPTLENGKYNLRGLSAKSGGYHIKVTDTNGCIEK